MLYMAMSATLVSSGYVNRRFVAFVGCAALREEGRKKSRTHGFGPRSVGYVVNSPGIRVPSQDGCMDYSHVEDNQESE
jgi:hypothetical protein